MYFGPSLAEVKKKRSMAAKKAAATRKLRKQDASVQHEYLNDLRRGLHCETTSRPLIKPFIPTTKEFAREPRQSMIVAACKGHGCDFADFVWEQSPHQYFDEVLIQLAYKVANSEETLYSSRVRAAANRLVVELQHQTKLQGN
ncbi:MAG: hypothetical protein EBU46_07135 [Nitrosomonadaceae bacterium]|nr:hypothetical protein [Nitrosomonadaceae bacterium]